MNDNVRQEGVAVQLEQDARVAAAERLESQLDPSQLAGLADEVRPADDEVEDAPTGGDKMGTLPGVFFPCLQNIFGVILFLRQPWITGQAGFVLAFVVVGTCVLTTFSTALSMSAIATNGKIPAGGTYFLISRTLGPEFGGAVGLSFYLGTTVAASMYIVGAVETLMKGLGLTLGSLSEGIGTRILGMCCTVAMTFVVFVGVKVVKVLGPCFLVPVILGILLTWVGIFSSFGAGKDSECRCPGEPCGEVVNLFSDSKIGTNLGPDFSEGQDIRTMFGLFFPSVTGIMAGANRSAVLMNPSVSIPRGTTAAILITGAVYLINVAIFAAVAERGRLKCLESLIVSDVAWPHPKVVQVSVLLSTVGAGLQSLTGAPRLLQAIAADRILPFLNPIMEDPEKDPRKTLALTFCITSMGVLVGDLNAITPIVTMFFLLFYAFTNLACLVLAILKPPSFRPDFRFYSWATAAMGLCLCLAIMFVINEWAAIGALLFAGGAYCYIMKYGEQHDWGDGLRGIKLQLVRNQLLELDGAGPFHYKNWRPQVLALTKVKVDEGNKPEFVEEEMMAFINHLSMGEGLTVVGTVIADHYEMGDLKLIDLRETLTETMHYKAMQSFLEVVAEQDLRRGISALIQVAGIGRFQPNIVLMGFPAHWAEMEEKKQTFITTLNLCERYQKAIVVFKTNGKYPTAQTRNPRTDRIRIIDIWWKPHGGGLLLLLPHLMQKHKAWGGVRVRCFTITRTGDPAQTALIKARVTALFAELRFKCEVQIVLFDEKYQAFSYPRSVMMAEGKELKNTLSAHRKKGRMTEEEELEEFEKTKREAAVARAATASTAPQSIQTKTEGDEQGGLNMETAERLNQHILQNCKESNLILCNLPRYGRGQDAQNLMEYVTTLTKGFPPCVMVKDSGREVTTSFF